MLFNNFFTFCSRRSVRRTTTFLLLLFIVLAPVQNVLGTPAVVHAADTGSPTNDLCTTGKASDCLSGIIYLFAVYLPVNFAYATGYLFNFALQLALNSASYAADFLSVGWTVVRDIANLSFIFILIYIAYTIIMRAETAGTMRTLAMVVAMALLINFSFFLTRVVIDAGNILSVQFYNAIPIAPSTESPLLSTPNTPTTYVKDLTAGIMDAVKVQGILSDSSFSAWKNDPAGGNSQTNGFWSNLGTLSLIFVSIGIFVSILGFIFLIVGVRFLVRVVILWLTIIASPLAFAAQAVPNKDVKKWYKMWQENLFQSSFYPAIFLFLFFIMTILLHALAGNKGMVPDLFAAANKLTSSNGQLGQGAVGGVISVIVNITVRMGLVTVLLVFAMKASDAVSSVGSGIANSVVSWAGGAASNVTSRAARMGMGTTAWAGRQTVGRGANALSRSDSIQALASNKGWKGAVFGRPIKAALEGAANGSYDVRGVPGVKSTLESVSKIPGANKLGLNLKLGKASTDNIRKQFKRRADNVEERAKQFKGDAVDIARKQDEFIKKYNREHDGAELTRLRTLEKASFYTANRESNSLLRQRALDAGREYTNRIKAIEENGSYAEKLKDLTKRKQAADLAHNKEDSKKYTKEIGELEGAGKKEVGRLETSYLNNFAKRIGDKNITNAYNPSRGSIAGAAKIKKMASGKDDLHDAAEKLAKIYNEEHAGHGEGHDEGGDNDNNPPTHPPSSPAPGGGSSGSGSGASTSATGGHGHASTGGHGGGHHASSNSEITLSKEDVDRLAQRVAYHLKPEGSNRNQGTMLDKEQTVKVLRQTLSETAPNSTDVGRQINTLRQSMERSGGEKRVLNDNVKPSFTPGSNAVWKNADHDIPVTIDSHAQRGSDGRDYHMVRDTAGNFTGAPADELHPPKTSAPPNNIDRAA